MPRIFIPNEPMKKDRNTGEWVRSFDLRQALVHGELVYLTSGRDVPLDPAPTISSMRVKLRDFNPDEDFFMPVGSPVIGAWAAAIIAEITGGRLNILYWDNALKRHIVYRGDISGRGD